MLTQEWINKIAQEEDAPIIGRTEEDERKDAWCLEYLAELIRAGLPIKFACEIYCASDEHDYASDPREAAQNEFDYFTDDGDG